MEKIFSILFVLLIPYSLNAKDQYPSTETVKFKTGEVQQKVRYSAYKSIEKSETFYQNGKNNISYTRTELSKDPYQPDVYKVQAWDDQARVIAEGKCYVSPMEDFDAKARCRVLEGQETHYGEDGKVVATTNFKRGKLDGESSLITKEKVTKTFYKDDVKVKLQEFDSVTNKLLKEENYFPDGSKK